MKNLKLLVFGLVLAASTNACTFYQRHETTGAPVGNKVGVSKTTSVLGIINGSYGIGDAAKNGGIEKVATIDVKATSYIFAVTYKTTVTGE